MAECRVCAGEFTATPNQIRKYDFICKPCRREKERAWRLQRKAEGRPVVSTKMPREYHAAYEAEWRERPGVRQRRAEQAQRRRQDPAEQVKARARRTTRTAVANGILKVEACEVCGAPTVDAHHDDYDRPLEVRWLCRQHHMAIHAKAEGRDNA